MALARLDALAIEASELHDWRRVGILHHARGNILMRSRRWPEAVVRFRAAIRRAWQVMNVYDLAHDVWDLPRALARSREPQAALTMAAFADRFWRRHVGVPTEAQQRDQARARRLAEKQLAKGGCATAWALGAHMSLKDAVDLALSPRV